MVSRGVRGVRGAGVLALCLWVSVLTMAQEGPAADDADGPSALRHAESRCWLCGLCALCVGISRGLGSGPSAGSITRRERRECRARLPASPLAQVSRGVRGVRGAGVLALGFCERLSARLGKRPVCRLNLTQRAQRTQGQTAGQSAEIVSRGVREVRGAGVLALGFSESFSCISCISWFKF